MKKLTLIFAAVGLLLCACEKEKNSASADALVGEWTNTNTNYSETMKFEKDGSFSQTDDGTVTKGTWELKGNDLTILTESTDPEAEGMIRWEVKVKLLGGNAAMVFEQEYEDEFSGKEVIRSLYYKNGAKVQSGTLKDGRYDAPHNGIKGSGNYDRTVSFVVKGNQLDLYVHAWGCHLRGTYKIENGVLNFNPTWGEHGQSSSGDWWAGEADIDFENFSFNNPDYGWVEGMTYQDVFSSFPMCVSDDGKELYLSFAGLTRWAFLR